ncbi:MAG: MFS transporter [Nocardioides sp.]|uniref:MFS transporter n=1 Tax=Nocardioides sp. TaxID=35761 RepID=UPI003F00AEDE
MGVDRVLAWLRTGHRPLGPERARAPLGPARPATRLTGGAWCRNFLLLVSAATIDKFGSAFLPVAIAFAVLDLGGSATELGLVVGAMALAEVLSTLFGGVLGDRILRKVLLEGSCAASAVVIPVMSAALLGGWASVPLLAGLSFLSGVVASFAGPSSSAMTPLTVPESELPQAISLRRLGQNAALVLGYGAAGLVVAFAGPGWALAVDAATFALAAVLFAGMRVASGTGPAGRPSWATWPQARARC